MIELVRVDHRLLHGQVASSWTNDVGANCILVISDTVVNDNVWKTTLKPGGPSGVKLVTKNMADSIAVINSGVTDKYKLIIVVQTIKEAKQFVDGCPCIASINLENTKENKTTTQTSKQVFLEDEEKAILKELVNRGVECKIHALVDDSKINVTHTLK